MASDSNDDRISPKPLGSSKPPHFSTGSGPVGDLPKLSRGEDDSEAGLSSLAQAARSKHLSSAKATLIIIGVLTLLLNIGGIFMVRSELETEMRKQGINMANPPAEVQAIIIASYALVGLFAALGVVFIVLGLLVRSYPVFCTVTGLVLYIVSWLVSGLLDPKNFVAGIIIKIIIVVALAKAVQAALAYQKDAAAAGAD